MTVNNLGSKKLISLYNLILSRDQFSLDPDINKETCTQCLPEQDV